MRNLIFILTFLTGANCFASSHFDILKDTFSTFATLTQFKSKLEIKFNDFRLSRKNVRLLRPLDFGFSQTVFEIEISYDKSSFKEFKVFLVSSYDSIILGTIQELDYYKKIKKSENFLASDRHIDNYLKEHKAKYGLQLSSKDFISQLTELIIYGFGCSEAGEYYPPEAKQMIAFVKNQSYDNLAKWLRQISPELQAYAIDGLLQLEKKGFKTKQEDKIIIQYLKKRNSDIYYCSGCFYGITTTIDEIIKWKQK